MARVTVEDCIDKVENRFDLVLLASHRARMISSGQQITVDRDNDKNPVVALREIAESTLKPDDLREEFIHSLQKHATAAKGKRRANYQRLEFLGDRVLGLVIAEMLFDAYPAAKEGELSKRLSDLVRRETCADVAREWGLAGYIRLGTGEASSGGSERIPILADVCEALIGAVFLDGGFNAARDLVHNAFDKRMASRSSLWSISIKTRRLPPPSRIALARKCWLLRATDAASSPHRTR